MIAITYRPAVRGKSFAMIGLAGPSGGGKTLSALKIARGLVMGADEQIFAIDTENGRMLHYAVEEGGEPDATHFRFQYAELGPPFTPMRYAEAIDAALKQKAAVVIVDSMSHEHEGEGGILEWHDRELTRLAGNNYELRDKMKFTAWIEPKKAHNRLVNKILQARCHFIFCFRAKDKIAPVKNSKGKVEFVSVGWTPICADRFEYETLALLVLPPMAQGVPDLGAERSKVQEQHAPAFPPGKALDEETGRMISRWCAGKSLAAKPERRENPKEDQRAPSPPPESPLGGNDEAPKSSKEPSAAAEYHPDMLQLYNELRPGLEATADPELWWRNHPKGLKILQESAPALYEGLLSLARTKKRAKGGSQMDFLR